jgi:F-type H+-transporting ATPase subunit alpha
LRTASTDELVTFPTGIQGLILNLDPHGVDVILLGQEEGIQGGDLVTSTSQRLQVPVGPTLAGRVINPLGEPLDERGPILAAESALLGRVAPGIVDRAPVDTPLQTGLKMIDALVPIGRGQRELIVGDRQTGKTSLAIDAILNQVDGDVVCVYVAIGQKKSSTAATIQVLRDFDAMAYTTVVVAGPDDPPALRYLAPYAGAAMAEFLMYGGRDVLIVYDDLTKHADAYRELSLLLRRPPGREAYPGDMFYAHSRLLERAARLSDAKGGGSLTALPIVEMQRGNIAAYIPTNLISICDGQIVLDSALFNQALIPAVDVGRSVSRVAGAAQTAAMREVAGRLRLELSQFEEVARFARFGTEIDDATRRQIQRGERLRIALTQPLHRTLSVAAQVLVLLAVTEGLVDDVPLREVAACEAKLVADFEAQSPDLFHEINQTGELPSGVRQALTEACATQRTAFGEAGQTAHAAAPQMPGDMTAGIVR